MSAASVMSVAERQGRTERMPLPNWNRSNC
jgi:hypothetical protein